MTSSGHGLKLCLQYFGYYMIPNELITSMIKHFSRIVESTHVYQPHNALMNCFHEERLA